jgi:hypothetical protein
MQSNELKVGRERKWYALSKRLGWEQGRLTIREGARYSPTVRVWSRPRKGHGKSLLTYLTALITLWLLIWWSSIKELNSSPPSASTQSTSFLTRTTMKSTVKNVIFDSTIC